MWRMWNELNEQQRQAARTMFSADPYIEMGWGWFVESDGALLCRRLAPAIKNWAATSPWDDIPSRPLTKVFDELHREFGEHFDRVPGAQSGQEENDD